MVNQEKLKICYLSDIPERIENFKDILIHSLNGKIKRFSQDRNRFYTNAVEYYIIDCRKFEKYEGLRMDQAIIDFRDPIKGIAEILTAKSRLPENQRIIDERSMRISDLQKEW